MPEVTAVVEELTPKEKGGSKLIVRTEQDQTRTLHIARNYEGDVPAVGQWGRFEFREWKPEDWGADRSAMKMVETFSPMPAPFGQTNGTPATNGNGSSGATTQNVQATVQTHSDRDASFALSYAKDIVIALIGIHGIENVQDAQMYWFSLADGGLTWLRQQQG